MPPPPRFVFPGSLFSISVAALVALTVSASPSQAARKPPRRPAAPAAPYTPFVRQILANFDRWDTDHNGVLSEKEVDVQVGFLENGDAAAAALASVKMILRGGKYDLPPMTRRYFVLYADHVLMARYAPKPPTLPAPVASESATNGTTAEDNAADDEAATKSTKRQGFPGYEGVYKDGLSRIQKSPRVLYTNVGPRLENIHQGRIGDCYLISVLGGMLNRNPDAFARMIVQQSDGTCKVILPSSRVIDVPNLTDTEVALSSSTSGTGRWLAVLEEAFGNLKNANLADEDKEDVTTDLISHGGSISHCIRHLTGHATAGTWFRRKAKGVLVPPTPKQIETRLPNIRERLTKTLGAGLLAGALVDKYARPPGITGNHAYAILAYTPATDRITIWNPHGNSFKPKGAPGLINGYVTHHGVFEMTLTEFMQIFARIDCETDQPYLTKSQRKTQKSG